SFGKITSESSPSNSGSLLYDGYAYNVDTGFYMAGNGTRFYNPATGDWVQRDPMGFDAGDSNLMRYVGNNPVNAIDPSGLWLVGKDYSAAKDYANWLAGEDGPLQKAYGRGPGIPGMEVVEISGNRWAIVTKNYQAVAKAMDKVSSWDKYLLECMMDS